MRNHGPWGIAAAAATLLLFTASAPAEAKSACSKDEKKPCSFYNVGNTGDKVFTDAGTFYGKHHALKGYSVAAKTEPKGTGEPPGAASAEPETRRAAAAAGGAKTPCGCDCPHGKECGHMHGKGEMPQMMEKMKGHLEEMKKAVASLRESEKAVEGAADLETLRKAVLSHLKTIDDLQESHLNHMESMMEARKGMMKGNPRCPDCP